MWEPICLLCKAFLEEEEAQGALAVTTRAVEDLRRALAQAQALVKNTQGQNTQLQKLVDAVGKSRFEACQAIKDLHATVEVGFNNSHDELATVTQQQTDDIKAAILAAAGGAPSAPLIAGLQDELQEQRANKENLEVYYLQLVIDVLSAESSGAGSFTGCAPADLPAAPSPPPELFCPIGLDLMKDPVMLVETHETYDRQNIERWFAEGHRTCPVSGHRILRDHTLVPNRSIYRLVEGWKDYKGRSPPSSSERGASTMADAAAQAQRARDARAEAEAARERERAAEAAAVAKREREEQARTEAAKQGAGTTADATVQAHCARDARAEAESAVTRECAAEAAANAKRMTAAERSGEGRLTVGLYRSLYHPQENHNPDRISSRERLGFTSGIYRTTPHVFSTMADAAARVPRAHDARTEAEVARMEAAKQERAEAQVKHAGTQGVGKASQHAKPKAAGAKRGGLAMRFERLFGKQEPKVDVPAATRTSSVIPYSQYRASRIERFRELGLEGRAPSPRPSEVNITENDTVDGTKQGAAREFVSPDLLNLSYRM
ncbi:hypothetical protein WJX72_000789 [[Myrmecia] bisecta]|uniref:U-box domain-containing protein n=1 Tax=[Myrmecia] bisecta TaxID=41462 RepID=A0AAW1P540_9CHLO